MRVLAIGLTVSACNLVQSLDGLTGGPPLPDGGTTDDGREPGEAPDGANPDGTDPNGTDPSGKADAGTNTGEADAGKDPGGAVDAGTDAGGTDDGLKDVPTCGDSEGRCLTPPPAAWKGPFALFEGAVDAAPECTKVIDDAFADLSAANASCGCTCSGVNGFTCATSVVTSKSASCSPCGATAALSANSCTPLPQCTDGSKFSHVMMRTSHVAGTGSCSPKSAGKTAPPPAWGRIARACEFTPHEDDPSECSGSCVTAPTSPFSKTACIAYEGDVACPAGPYKHKKTFHRNVNDGRDCTCTCAAPKVTCGGNIFVVPALYSVAASCGTNDNGITVQWNACVAASATTYTNANYNPLALSATGSCAPIDTPSGQATPSKPVTICCM